jgi:hypothetical protein
VLFNVFLVSTIPPIASTLVTSLNSFWRIGHYINGDVVEKYYLTPKLLVQKQPTLKSEHSIILFLLITCEILSQVLPILAAEVCVGWVQSWNSKPIKEVEEAKLSIYWLPVRVVSGLFLGNLSNWMGSWRYLQNVANIAHWRGEEVLDVALEEKIYDLEAEACKIPLPSDEEFI